MLSRIGPSGRKDGKANLVLFLQIKIRWVTYHSTYCSPLLFGRQSLLVCVLSRITGQCELSSSVAIASRNKWKVWFDEIWVINWYHFISMFSLVIEIVESISKCFTRRDIHVFWSRRLSLQSFCWFFFFFTAR